MAELANASQCKIPPKACLHPSGIAQGARILTLDGLIPVEYLLPEDRIVTRAGARPLRQIAMSLGKGLAVRLEPGCLGHERPGHALHLTANTPIVLRDWRAQALCGARQVLLAVSRLIDGKRVVVAASDALRFFTLEFDAPQIIYCDGVEIGCHAVERPPGRLPPKPRGF